MPKRIVDAYLADGTVRSYKIGLRAARTAFTDDEYIGIAKQYHVEDGFTLEAVEKWVLHPISTSASRKPPE